MLVNPPSKKPMTIHPFEHSTSVCILCSTLTFSSPRSSFFKNFFLFLTALGLRCCTRAFSSCGERGLLFVAARGLFTVVASLVMEHGLQARRLQQLCLPGSRAQAQQLWRTGLVALQHVGSSWTRARTRVPCIGRKILNHCATREAPAKSSYLSSPCTTDSCTTKNASITLPPQTTKSFSFFLFLFNLMRGIYSQFFSSIFCYVQCTDIYIYIFNHHYHFFFFDNAAQLVGSQFPNQGLNLCPQQ